MDIIKWLEPSIAESGLRFAEKCNREFKTLDDEFKSAFLYIKEKHPDVLDKLLILEAQYVRKDELMEVAFRKGFEECFSIVSELKPR